MAVLTAVSGCFTTDAARPGGLIKRWQQAGLQDNAVQLDVAFVMRPVGDHYLNHELWTHSDEMIVEFERCAPLEDNGLRVGQIVGMTPQGLQDLLKSERSCPHPRRRLLPAEQTGTEYLGDLLAQTAFDVKQQGQTQHVVLDRARFCLDVTPHLNQDGGIRLQFLPKVEHGENLLPFRADPKQAAWVLSTEKPSKAFPSFGWEINVPPGALLLIGAQLDRPESFGYRALVEEDGPQRGQRLLVLRPGRPLKNRETSNLSLESAVNRRAAPLAHQASMTAAQSGQP